MADRLTTRPTLKPTSSDCEALAGALIPLPRNDRSIQALPSVVAICLEDTVTYDPNDGRRPDILRKHDDSVSGALMGGIAIALLLLFGIAIFALSSGNRDVAGTDSPRMERTTPAPSTTGQGGTQIMPGRDQNIPNPTPPANPGQGTGAK